MDAKMIEEIEEIVNEISFFYFGNTCLSKEYADCLGNRVARFIYASHIRPLEEALSLAESGRDGLQKWGGEDRDFIDAVTAAFYAGFPNQLIEQRIGSVAKHGPHHKCLDVLRERLQRAHKCEDDKVVLVEALEKCVPVLEAADEFFNGVSAALTQARAALASVKGEA